MPALVYPDRIDLAIGRFPFTSEGPDGEVLPNQVAGRLQLIDLRFALDVLEAVLECFELEVFCRIKARLQVEVRAMGVFGFVRFFHHDTFRSEIWGPALRTLRALRGLEDPGSAHLSTLQV